MDLTMNNLLLQQLKRHEGFRTRVYQCTGGFDTIGYGYNLNANPLKLTNYEIVKFRKEGINEKVAEWLLLRMIDQCTGQVAKSLDWFESLNDARQCVLINMCFNLGLKGLLGFKTTLAMAKAGHYDLAAENMLKSKWAGQVKGRAVELSAQMRTGKFQ